MAAQRPARQILENDFLTVRCMILDLAAALDRIDRGDGREQIADDAQLQLLQQGVKLLDQAGPGRAEQLQLLFSDEYVPGWNA